MTANNLVCLMAIIKDSHSSDYQRQIRVRPLNRFYAWYSQYNKRSATPAHSKG